MANDLGVEKTKSKEGKSGILSGKIVMTSSPNSSPAAKNNENS